MLLAKKKRLEKNKMARIRGEKEKLVISRFPHGILSSIIQLGEAAPECSTRLQEVQLFLSQLICGNRAVSAKQDRLEMFSAQEGKQPFEFSEGVYTIHISSTKEVGKFKDPWSTKTIPWPKNGAHIRARALGVIKRSIRSCDPWSPSIHNPKAISEEITEITQRLTAECVVLEEGAKVTSKSYRMTMAATITNLIHLNPGQQHGPLINWGNWSVNKAMISNGLKSYLDPTYQSGAEWGEFWDFLIPNQFKKV